MSTLDAQLLAAHARGDGRKMVELYLEAAGAASSEDERAFLLTQAHVFAMETEHPAAASLREALVQMRRETPL